MKIEHIIWKDFNYYLSDKTVSGLLEIEVVWHGGGSDTFVAEGIYTDTGRGEFVNRLIGVCINEETMGVSGVHCLRVGEIVE